uniref:Palmitoyltransferase n=1 Tax=Timema shepardi TaxID=629360 RepID=A0A7R9AXY3_TIMSH|nr:unnamed protein product [Timema shepardi]
MGVFKNRVAKSRVARVTHMSELRELAQFGRARSKVSHWTADGREIGVRILFFVFSVCGLTASVIVIAYWIGLPYWWNKSPMTTVALLLVGHWLLVNICFHYYMAASTLPGYPPEDTLIPEAASICKKCIAPKPPRTHHCSVCNKCILKMDHHCRNLYS